MTVSEYEQKIKEIGFEEYPVAVNIDQYLKDFIKCKKVNLDLRIHLTKVIICRSLMIKGGIYLPYDTEWWIKEFRRVHIGNLADFTRSEVIIEAVKQIQSKETFSKCIIGTAFMYTVMEFYTKYFLGFNPIIDRYEEDKTKIEKYQDVKLPEAIIKLKKRPKEISKQLCELDKFFKMKAEEIYLSSEPFRNNYISYRLSHNRNKVLHGENPFLHSEGTFLVLLYILYTYCHMKEMNNET